MYKLSLSEVFACRLDSEAYSFFAQYLRMVNWWIVHGRDVVQEFRDFNAFRNQFYSAWKAGWSGYNSQHAQTSCMFAYKTLNSTIQKSEVPKQSFVIVSPVLAKIEENQTLIFTTMQTKKARVKLVSKTSAQNVLLEQALNMYWQIGQVLLTPTWCAIPFSREIDLTQEKDVILQEFLKHNL
jgi:hypothetical protein